MRMQNLHTLADLQKSKTGMIPISSRREGSNDTLGVSPADANQPKISIKLNVEFVKKLTKND
jgi:hypothetical protein